MLFLLIFDTWWYLKNKAIAQAPPSYPPQKGGRRIKGISRFLLSQTKEPVLSGLILPGIFCLGAVTRDFWLDLGDIIALLYMWFIRRHVFDGYRWDFIPMSEVHS